MTTPSLQMSFEIFCKWIIWKISLIIYLMCIAVPISFFITSLFIIGISRESSPSLSLTMAISLHPVVTIPIAVLAKNLGHCLFSKSQTKPGLVFKILSRTFTYSLNCHLAIIAGLIIYLIKLWFVFEDSTSLNFSNRPFDQCRCNILSEFYLEDQCTNEEALYSFQNKFLNVPIESILIAFLIVSISCHLIHSIFVALPPPLPLLQFSLGHIRNKSNDDIDGSRSRSNKKNFINRFNIPCCILGTMFFAGSITSPYFTFDFFKGNGKS